MSDKTPAKSLGGFRRVPILILITALWLLMLTAVSLPATSDQINHDPNIERGGRLYVAWDIYARPDTSIMPQHPLWPQDTPDQVPQVHTWRCVNCHGWDYNGSQGKTLRPVLRAQAYPGLFNFTAQPLENILPSLNGELNPDHNFSHYLSENDLLDLAAFISSGLVVPGLIADTETFKVDGTLSIGTESYDQYCRYCHGVDGEKINLTTVQQPTFLGDLAWENPWRIAHIIRYGHIHAQVPDAARLGIPFSQQIDITAYTQTLPNARTITGPDYQNIDLSAQASTAKLAFGAVLITLLVYSAVGITLWSAKKDSGK